MHRFIEVFQMYREDLISYVFIIGVLFLMLVNFNHYTSVPFTDQRWKRNITRFVKLWNTLGEWEPGLKYNQTCRLKHYKSCCKYEKGRKQLHFVFLQEALNNRNELAIFKKKVEGKNVTFFGDSLQRQIFQWTAEVLGIEGKIAKEQKAMGNGITKVWQYIKPLGKTIIRRFGFFGFEQVGCGHFKKHIFQTNRTYFVEALNVTDIIVLNMGHHVSSCTAMELLEQLEKMARVIKDHIKVFPHKQVIIRSTLPTHSLCTKFHRANYREHWGNFYLKKIANQYNFKYLDSHLIYSERPDLHEGRDCSHYCYTPELVVPELTLFNRLLSSPTRT